MAKSDYDGWIFLIDLRPGAVFETRDGIRAVKSEYRVRDNGSQCECILLESGEYAHFPGRDGTMVRELEVQAWRPPPKR